MAAALVLVVTVGVDAGAPGAVPSALLAAVPAVLSTAVRPGRPR
jgi:hypothetical protein